MKTKYLITITYGVRKIINKRERENELFIEPNYNPPGIKNYYRQSSFIKT